MAAALGLGEKATRSPLAQLSEYVADKQLLIVLDNCEHVVRSCAVLAAKLLSAAPKLRILATSRQALAIEGEHLLTVPPLSVPPDPAAGEPVGRCSSSEAVQLLTERASAVAHGFAVTACNRGAVDGICRRLDGIPLAIELAAVQLRAFSPEALLQRLDDRFRLLKRGSRAALPRHQTLSAAIEWSHELCAPHERLLWARMSVFAGACDLEAIEQVCAGDGLDVEEIPELVAGLVDKSIILREDRGGRAGYRLLETIREFGRELMTASGEEPKILSRHFAYYRRLTELAETEWFSPRQAEWFARMRLEQPNLRTALEYSLTSDQALAGLEAAAVLHIPWVITGVLREGCRWLERALAVNPADTRSRAKALHGCAYLLIMLGDIDNALAKLAECRTLGERLGDASALAYATLRAGQAKMYQGDVASALPLLEEALARQRELGDAFGVYFALRYLAMAATAAADPRAEDLGKECLALCEAHSADLSRSWALWVVGLDNWRRGDTERATTAIRESLRLKSLVGDLAGEAHCIEVLAWIAVNTDDMKRAAELFGAARAIWHKVGSCLVEFGYLRRYEDPAEQRARQALGDDAYSRLFRTGEELDVDEAIACALEETPGLAPPVAWESEPALTPRELDHPASITSCSSPTPASTARPLSPRRRSCGRCSVGRRRCG